MTKQELYNISVEYYEHIYRRVLMYNDFAFIPSENQKKQINNFLDYLDKEIGLESIGKEWVWNYMIYLFKERSQQKSRYKDKIPLNWILGKKSYLLYLKKNDSWLYFNDVFIKDRSILKKEFNENMELKTGEYHEDLRKQYYNKKVPLSLCYNTVPFEEKSKYCLQCKDRILCKKVNY